MHTRHAPAQSTICTRREARTNARAWTHTHGARARTHARAHTHIHARTHYTHTHTRTHTNALTHARTHTHTHTHTYTHTHTQNTTHNHRQAHTFTRTDASKHARTHPASKIMCVLYSQPCELIDCRSSRKHWVFKKRSQNLLWSICFCLPLYSVYCTIFNTSVWSLSCSVTSLIELSLIGVNVFNFAGCDFFCVANWHNYLLSRAEGLNFWA